MNRCKLIRVSVGPHWLAMVSLIVLGWLCPASVGRGQATMTIDFTDEATGQSIPCRVELRDAKGRPLKARGELYHAPWTIVDGQLIFKGRAGDYKFDVFHGPEYSSGGGGFTLDKKGEGGDTVRLPRHANMADEGYFGGDLLTEIPSQDLQAWMPAEALTLAAVVRRASRDSAAGEPEQASNKVADSPKSPDKQPKPQSKPPTKPPTKSPARQMKPSSPAADTEPADQSAVTSSKTSGAAPLWLAGPSYFDDSPGSGLILHNWQPPADLPAKVTSSRLLAMAKESSQTRAEIARLWAADTPIWLASGKIDAIQILSQHVTRDGQTDTKLSDMYHPEPARFKGPRGPGRLVENLYWQVLETGLRIPPSAGSGVGQSGSPLGYNRVYVQLPGTLRDTERWWEGWSAGRSFVTNGPLLRATINQELPGSILRPGRLGLKLDVALKLTVSDPVEYVDVVFNGQAIYHARLDEYAKQGGKIPELDIQESGWIVVRVVTSREETYRLATTAPFYVEFDERPRISRAACQMFLDWLGVSGKDRPKDKDFQAATTFWQQRLADSNCP